MVKMSLCKVVIFVGLALIPSPVPTVAEDFTNALHAYLQRRVEVERKDVGIVVGIADEHGSGIVSCGKMALGSDQQVNGDTLIEIGSVTKTFTGLLLQEMVERGEMKLDDPVAKYLPRSVKLPRRNGKEITLLQLATHTSGLPRMPENFRPKRADNPYADYTDESMYSFLSGCQLTRDPGAQYEYSNLGMGLLGHVIALKAGADYESLVVDRICRPLKLDSTRITLTPELKARFATGHNQWGEPVPSWNNPTLTGCGGLCSTANDLLKYLSANFGLTPSSLTPLMKETHVARCDISTNIQSGMAWEINHSQPGTTIIFHAGGTGGYSTFAGFDLARRHAVVVLSNSRVSDLPAIGFTILQLEWQSDRRPKEIKMSSQVYDSYVGQYQLVPDGVTQSSANMSGASAQAGIGIRREGDRLFAQTTGSNPWPVNVVVPLGAGELLPGSETRFFNRLTSMPVTFSRDDRGKVISLTAGIPGTEFSYRKISDQPPQVPEVPTPRVIAKLDPKLLDACVGQYEFETNNAFPAGLKLVIWREGDQLVSGLRDKNGTRSAAEICPASETNFFLKIDGSRLTFIKNEKGEVTSVIHHPSGAGLPDRLGRKLED